MSLRLRLGGLAMAVSALALTAAAASAAPTVRAPITQAQSGKTIRLVKGQTATLRLSGRWAWTEPRASKAVIALTPVEYLVDPGFSEWQIDTRGRGRTAIRSIGRPSCSGCALTTRSFLVTIVVQ